MKSLADQLAPGPYGGPPASWYPPQPWRVVARTQESPDTVTVDLAPPDDSRYSFRPGQFNMLYAFGAGEVPISVSGDPASTELVRHTIRDVGLVTHALCGLVPGERVGVRGPYGTHWPLAEAEQGDVIVMAGGLAQPLRCGSTGHRGRCHQLLAELGHADDRA